jgi:hypothetical protein
MGHSWGNFFVTSDRLIFTPFFSPMREVSIPLSAIYEAHVLRKAALLIPAIPGEALSLRTDSGRHRFVVGEWAPKIADYVNARLDK